MDLLGLLAYQDDMRKRALNRHTMTSAQKEDAFYAFYAKPLWPRLSRIERILRNTMRLCRWRPSVTADAGKTEEPLALKSDLVAQPRSISP